MTASRTPTPRPSVAVASMHAMATGTLADLAAVAHPDAVNREAADEPPAAAVPGPTAFWATALLAPDRLLRPGLRDPRDRGRRRPRRRAQHDVRPADGGVHRLRRRVGSRWSCRPPGGEFASTQTHWFRFRDGLVVEHWANRDDLATAEQLGWVPPTPAFLLRQADRHPRARRRAARAARVGRDHGE